MLRKNLALQAGSMRLQVDHWGVAGAPEGAVGGEHAVWEGQ